MQLYARSDLTAVSIPVEGGGCGITHARPVVQGAPSKLWPLSCPQCTQVLRDDPLWAMDKLKIPLTPDEESVAGEMEKRGDQVMHQVSAALAQNSLREMRAAQTDDLEASRMSLQLQAAEERYNALQAELTEMRAFMKAASFQPAVTTSSTTGTSNLPYIVTSLGASGPEAEPQAAPRATAKSDTTPKHGAPQGNVGSCKSCGGPLRLKGQRGPTPKGTCMNCRAKAKAA
jgi:hypothetical protein